MRKYTLEIVVFITGAVVMALEIVGSRVLAPYVGTSIIVWTSLIGIILASLSLGYWLGGRIADKNPHRRLLARIILSAGLLIGLVSFVKAPLLSLIENSFSDIRLASVLSTLILFAPPSLFLGMVLPYAVRLKLRSLKKSVVEPLEIYLLFLQSVVSWGLFLPDFSCLPTWVTPKF